MEATFLSPAFNYPGALKGIRNWCSRLLTLDTPEEYRRNVQDTMRLIDGSEQLVHKNRSPTIIVPEGGLLGLMTITEYDAFSRKLVDTARESPCSVEGGICSIFFNTVQLMDGDVFVTVMANIPLTTDTVIVSKFEIIESLSTMMCRPVLSSVFSAHSDEAAGSSSSLTLNNRGGLVAPGLSTNHGIRCELFAQESMKAGLALCGEALIPFGSRPEMDRAWQMSLAYYELVHEGVEFRPSLFNPATGEVHSCLWMANDALAPCAEYPHAAGVNCDLMVMDDVDEFLALFPPVDPDELHEYPEMHTVIRTNKVPEGWRFYVLCSTQNISKGSPLRFSYGLYSEFDNRRNAYRERGVRRPCSELMFFDDTRPFPSVCKVYPCTQLTSGGTEGE